MSAGGHHHIGQHYAVLRREQQLGAEARQRKPISLRSNQPTGCQQLPLRMPRDPLFFKFVDWGDPALPLQHTKVKTHAPRVGEVEATRGLSELLG